jgi:hypothetical protein
VIAGLLDAFASSRCPNEPFVLLKINSAKQPQSFVISLDCRGLPVTGLAKAAIHFFKTTQTSVDINAKMPHRRHYLTWQNLGIVSSGL